MSDTRNIGIIVRHFKWIFYLFFLIGMMAIGKIIQVQCSEDKAIPDSNYKSVPIKAIRGSILASDGRTLATSMPYYEIRMDFGVINDSIFNADAPALAESLSSMFKNKSAKAYLYQLRKYKKANKRYQLIANRTIDYVELEKLKKFPILKLGQFKGGLIVIRENKRTYPYGGLAYRTIGYVNNNGVGVGIEKSYDYILKGKDGSQKMIRKLGGEWIPVTSEKVIPAVNGFNIKTTIDINIQEAAETALREQLKQSDLLKGGTAIVMEVKTGAIKAISNMQKNNGRFDETYNYAIGDATEPGSTLKLATLVCLLEDGYVSLNDSIDAGHGPWRYAGRNITDSHAAGFGKLTVKGAFEKSSNICFAKLATKYYANQEDKFVSRFHELKICDKLNLDIDGEARATIYSPESKMWSKLSLPMMGFGYGVLITPMHTLNFYNAIANNGKMMKPHFIEQFINQDGTVEKNFPPQTISGSICSKHTVREVKKALRGVVAEGTAKSINDERYQISGKTGTAQMALKEGGYIDRFGYKKHQASFVGFFPSDNPQYSCIVVMYSSKTRGNFYGGSWAAPVFKKISDIIYINHPEWNEVEDGAGKLTKDFPDVAGGRAKELNIVASNLPMKRPDINGKAWISINKDTIQGISIESNRMPNVLNMGLKDALYILENEGYSVSSSGVGRIVKQYPEPGAVTNKNTKIILELSDNELK